MLIKNIKFPSGLNKWLSYIPYAVLGALIFPGIMGSHPEPSYGIIAGIVAILLAWVQKQLLLVVAGSLVTMFILQNLSI